jgi:hypothetical protein
LVFVRAIVASRKIIAASLAIVPVLLLVSHAEAVGQISPAAGRSVSSAQKKNPRDAFAGDEACGPCHQQELSTYRTTAHHSTSSLPDAHSVAANFSPGSNTLRTSNPSLLFRMSSTQDGYSVTAVDQLDPSHAIELTERVDIVIGSGRKAQTYLYWKGDDLFELPVSYWTTFGQWANSPGYADGSLHFDRPIVPRCLECHGSYFESLAPPPNRYRKGSLVLGVTCEKCHGPGRGHIATYESHPGPRHRAAAAILNPVRLSRSRQLDACALCHAGAGTSIAAALSFAPGDDLKKYLAIPEAGPGAAVDVHGNQVELLETSRCFRLSNLTCTTCHDVHRPQRAAAAFSQNCLACHKAPECGEYAKLGAQIAANCVDCHMPLQKSELLFSQSNGQELRPLVRNHRIAIYPPKAP